MIKRSELTRVRVPRGTETKYERDEAVMSKDGKTVARVEAVQREAIRMYYCQRPDGTTYWKPQSPPTTPGHSFTKYRRKGGELSDGCGPWTVPEEIAS